MLRKNPITMEQALTANEFHEGNCTREIGPRGGVREQMRVWRRNGRTKLWKTRPDDFEVPIKHGLRNYGYIDEDNAYRFHTTAECPLNAPGPRLSIGPVLGPAEPKPMLDILRDKIMWQGDKDELQQVEGMIDNAYSSGQISYEDRDYLRDLIDGRLAGIEEGKTFTPSDFIDDEAEERARERAYRGRDAEWYQKVIRGEINENPGRRQWMVVGIGIAVLVAIKWLHRGK